MSSINFFAGNREDIPIMFVPQLLELQQMNLEEIFQTKPPTIDYFKKMWIIVPTCRDKRWVIAVRNGKVLGYSSFTWNVKYDNLDKGYFWVFVRQEERGKGIGRQLLLKVLELVPDIIGTISASCFENSNGIHFMNHLKEKQNYTEIGSISNLMEFKLSEVIKEAENLRKSAEEKGYEIIYVEDLDFRLHVNMNDFVLMVEEIWNDMPVEELSDTVDKVTIERFEELLQNEFCWGYKRYNFLAIHKETRKPVGITATRINKYNPEFAEQDDTGVLRKHRGNNLGLTLKYQMLSKLLQDTQAKYWRTGNAGSNEHMLRINKILKYKPYTKELVFEFKKQELFSKVKELNQ